MAWRLGHYYANPSNWMWRILRETGIAPSDQISSASDDHLMPEIAGVGFTDVGSGIPETDSSKFTSNDFLEWRQPFYDRLAAYAARASSSIDCICGKCGAPAVVAFSGKRQFSELFIAPTKGKNSNDMKNKSITSFSNLIHSQINEPTTNANIRTQSVRPSEIPAGRQTILPSGWPFPLESTEVWVMTSTSGASALTREKRYTPWQALAERIQQEPWPRYTEYIKPKCRTKK